jgi:hypothetical protein
MTVKAKADAIDRFVRTLKSGGLYDDINAACIMAGWTNLAGALYPLKGAAPTNNGFLASDLDAGIGLKGDGATKYLDTNRPSNADGKDDFHQSCYVSELNSGNAYYIGQDSGGSAGSTSVFKSAASVGYRNRSSGFDVIGTNATGFLGQGRLSSSEYFVRSNATSATQARTSQNPTSTNVAVFAGSPDFAVARGDARLAFYSLGSALDLAALDSAVSTLMADLRAIDEDGFEPETVNYLRAVEAADGAFLESGVKKAINRFIVGCKKDGIWDAIKACCILCGARTIAGALVPLAGTAPTAYGGWASGDYNRETGLVGNGTTKYLDTNRSGDDDPSTDGHLSVFATSVTPNAAMIGYYSSTPFFSYSYLFSNATGTNYSLKTGSQAANIGTQGAGLYGVSKTGVTPGKLDARLNGTDYTATFTDVASQNLRYFVFCRNLNGAPASFTTSRIAFYSVGSSLSLSALDARVTTLVSEIAAAIP